MPVKEKKRKLAAEIESRMDASVKMAQEIRRILGMEAGTEKQPVRVTDILELDAVAQQMPAQIAPGKRTKRESVADQVLRMSNARAAHKDVPVPVNITGQLALRGIYLCGELEKLVCDLNQLSEEAFRNDTFKEVDSAVHTARNLFCNAFENTAMGEMAKALSAVKK